MPLETVSYVRFRFSWCYDLTERHIRRHVEHLVSYSLRCFMACMTCKGDQAGVAIERLVGSGKSTTIVPEMSGHKEVMTRQSFHQGCMKHPRLSCHLLIHCEL